MELDPDLVLVLFLPPLLYAAAFFSSLRDLRANLRTISMLSIGLVAVTMCVVAVVAHAVIDGLPWAMAFALGAIVAPTDPLAATTIARRLGVAAPDRDRDRGREPDQRRDRAGRLPGRGRGCGRRQLLAWEAGAEFIWTAVGGVLVGLLVGWSWPRSARGSTTRRWRSRSR